MNEAVLTILMENRLSMLHLFQKPETKNSNQFLRFYLIRRKNLEITSSGNLCTFEF